jgi:CBS domain-containing protein
MRVADLLRGEPPSVPPDESAAAAWERMISLHVNDLLVLDGDRVVGVLSRHDLTGPAGGGRRRMGRTVAELMHRDVPSVTPETSVRRAVRVMRRVRSLSVPVVRRGKPIGLLTADRLLEELERIID